MNTSLTLPKEDDMGRDCCGGMAEKRFLVAVTVEYEEGLEDGRATDAALAALEGIGRALFPARAAGGDGVWRTVSLAGMEILGG
jgi:hypothetical protein